jgi:hypothetical protein
VCHFQWKLRVRKLFVNWSLEIFCYRSRQKVKADFAVP